MYQQLMFLWSSEKDYHKFLYFQLFFCNLPKIQIKRPNLRIFFKKDANGIANSEDPDQTAPLGVEG